MVKNLRVDPLPKVTASTTSMVIKILSSLLITDDCFLFFFWGLRMDLSVCVFVFMLFCNIKGFCKREKESVRAIL